MIFRLSFVTCLYLMMSTFVTHPSWAEPLVIFEYSSQKESYSGDGENLFSIDPDHSENYTVKAGDSLNSILQQFYRGSGLDWRFVQLSIMIANPDAFAKNNPNFLFSDKRLYLPGKADITKLMIGTKVTKNHGGEDDDSRTKSLYFFGG